MEPHLDDSEPDCAQIVEAIVEHIQRGVEVDWRLRCGHFINALRLVQQHAASAKTLPISKKQQSLLNQHFDVMRDLLTSNNSVGSPAGAARMFEAVRYLIRTWAQPRHSSAPAEAEGAVLQAGIRSNMLETALGFYALALWDQSLEAELIQDRAALFNRLLDVSGVDVDQLGGV